MLRRAGLFAAVVVSGCSLIGPVLEPPKAVASPVALIDVRHTDCPSIAGTYSYDTRVIEILEGGNKEYEGRSLEIYGQLLSRTGSIETTVGESELPNVKEVRISQDGDRIILQTRHYTEPKLFTQTIVRGTDYDCRDGYLEFPNRIRNGGSEGGISNYQEIARVSKSNSGDLVVYVLEGPYRQTMTRSGDDFTHTFYVYESSSSQ